MDIDLFGWCCGTVFIIGSTFVTTVLLFIRKRRKK